MKPWQIEQLENLRRENQPERPALRIHAPEPRQQPRKSERSEPQAERGACIINLTI